MKTIKMIGLFLLAVLVSGVLFLYVTEGAVAFSTKIVKVGEKHKVDAAFIQRIDIDSNSTDVHLRPYKGDKIEVDFTGAVSEKMKDAYKLTIMEDDETLSIQLIRNKRPSFTIFAIHAGTKLTVKVPEKIYEEIKVSSSSGDIMATQLEGQSISISAHSGDMLVEQLSGENVQISSQSGDITANEVLGMDTTTVKASSGDIQFKTNNDNLTLLAKTNSGNLNIDVTDLLFVMKDEERVEGVVGAGDTFLTIQTSSGDIRMEQ